tara:strand:+ start:6122 stop:6514 length:393 start_codon:yes stop_codon:yes gene_type:complete
MKLESVKTVSELNNNLLFEKLCNVENFNKIMPQNISKFEIIDEYTFVFSLKGMPSIKLKIDEKENPNRIKLSSLDSKIVFSLTAHILENDNNTSLFYLEFSGNLNPMMVMMVKTPLQTFIDELSSNINSF